MSTIDLKDIQQKLYASLKESGWDRILKGFILSDDFHSILKELLTQSQSDKRFTPLLKQLFRAFEECPYDELKIVMVTQDPYPKANDADGIAFSCSIGGVIRPTLRYIFEELERTVDPEYVQNPDLKRWSNQGILMLNTSLTTTVGKIGPHVELWKPFTTYLLDVLGSYNNGLLYVFMGNTAKDWSKMVPKTNYKFFTTYPGSGTAYTKSQHWNSGNMFNQVNKVLKENYNTEIKW